MHTGKKKKILPEDGSQEKDTSSIGPVNDPGPNSTNPSQEEIPGSRVESFSRKLKEHSEDDASDVQTKVPVPTEAVP